MAEQDELSYYTSGIHLWRSVIYRAMREADGIDLVCMARNESQAELQREARAFLTHKSWDLWALCELSNLKLDDLLKEMRTKYGQLLP